MGGVRKFMLVLAAALCAAVLAACGGDDDSTSSSGTDATSAGSTVAGGDGSADQSGDGNGGDGSQTGGKDGPGGGGGGDDSNGGSGGNGDGGSGGSGGGQGGNGGGSADIDFNGPPVRHDHPEPVDGQRSDGFRTPGGDNSIQEYGEEQDSEERAEAMKPIVALYRALESGDWTTVCSTYLSKPNVEQIKLLAEKSPKIKGSDCATVLSGLNQATGLRGPDTPDGEIVSFRTEGDTGFAIWWGIDGKGYAMPLKSEDGAWKLTALAPTPLSFGT